MIPGNESINSSHFPYQACLIPNLPEDLQHQVQDISNYIVIPLDTVLAVMSFICNTLVFITISRTKSLRHPSLMMLCSLSITDIIWAMITLTRNILIMVHPHMCPSYVNDMQRFTVLCFLATLSNLALISRDRYLAMSKPAWYRSHVSRSRACVVKKALLAWLSSILITLAVYTLFTFHFNAKTAIVVIFSFYVPCFFTIFFNYVRVFMARKLHSKKMRIQVGNVRAATEREKKMTRTISLILLCFMLTFLPALLSPVVLVALGFAPFHPFRPFTSLLFTINGLFNPLLNYGRNKDVHRAMLNALSSCRHRRTTPKLSAAVRSNINFTQENNISLESRQGHFQELHFSNN